MKHEDFMKLMTETFDLATNLCAKKGEEYAKKDSDRHSQFKKIAWLTNIPDSKIPIVLCAKHFTALAENIENLSIEKADEYILDILVYLCHARALVIGNMNTIDTCPR